MIVHFPDLQLDYFGTEEASIGKLSSVIAIPFVCMKRHEIPLFRGRTRRYITIIRMPYQTTIFGHVLGPRNLHVDRIRRSPFDPGHLG